ncbi:MAG: hypothetical protein ACU88J_01445 [Gammaproteobacteria bacterium]
MNKHRLAWAITGSGHYLEECMDFLLTLDDVDLYLSLAAEEVIKMYGMNLYDIRKKMPVYRDKTASSPPVGHFYKGYYHTFEYTTVVKSADELIVTVKERLAFVSRLYEPLIKLSGFATFPEREC